MEFESTNSGTTAKLPILKLGEYEMWVIRIKQYFQIQDYALWEVIENGDSWVSVPQTAQENGTSVTKMSIPVTAEEKTNKKNDVKARSLLLMALPNEHQLTFSQYPDAKSMFAAIETRFGGNAATKKTQKTLLKQQYENFSASSAESLDSIFNRLQKIVSRLAILVVWRNKPEVKTMSIDYLYNNFKIVEQKVKKSVGASSGAQNLAFMTAPSTSSTNDANTTSPQVSTASPNVNAASPQVSTASVSDNTEAMDLKWQLSLLSVRAKKYYQRTCKKIFINANDTAGYDKSKVECYNCHTLGHFVWECRAPRSKEGRFRNQDNIRKQGNNEDTSSKAMLAIDGICFDWSEMAEEQDQTNMALMAFSDSEVYTDKTCSKTCLKSFETLKKQYDDLIVKLNQTKFIAATYKRGLATVKDQLITYRKNEVLSSEEVAVLKREVACKDYEINVLKSEFEKVKQEKDGIEFKIEKFDKASKDLDQLLGSQITDKSKKGLGYSAVHPPHPLIYNRPKKLDLSYSGLDEFKEPEFKGYGPKDSEQVSNVVCDKKSYNSKENSEESLVEEQVSQDTSSFVESLPNVDKETIFPVNKKINYDNYQRKGIVSRNNYSRVDAKTTHPSVHRNMSPKAVLLKTGLTPLNTVRPVNTAHPKAAVYSAKSKSHFFKQAQSTAKRPFYNQTALTRRSVHTAKGHYYNGRPRAVNTARFYSRQVNAVRVKGVNVVKSSAYWVWRPTKPNDKPQHDDKGFIDSGCSRHMTENIAYLSDFKEFDRGYVAFGGGAYGGRITGKGTLKIDNLDFKDVYFVNKDLNQQALLKLLSDLLGGNNAEDTFCNSNINRFKDPDHPDKVYKVVKALYGLHQAPKACQDKYVAEILKKYNYTDVKSASTPVDLEKPLVKDGDTDDVDISSLWYSRDSPFELVAYTDSDYARATQDRKSTTGGCQFLGNRLISWQCKKQTVVATSTTEAEYVAAASCCGQVLWIQNQLLDYGYNFMNTVINIDNNNLLTKGFDAGRHFKRGQDTKIPQSSGLLEKGSNLRCQDTILGDVDAQTRFETTSKQSNDPPLLRGNYWCIEVNAAQLKLNAAKLKLQALIDKNSRSYTKVKHYDELHLEDAKESECFPTATIFEELAKMGNIFQVSKEVGEDSDHPTDSNQIPIIDQPSTSSQPKKKQKSKRKQRKEAEVSHDESEHEESVLDLEKAKSDQAIEIASLKNRVEKIERRRKFRTTGFKRLKKLGAARRIRKFQELNRRLAVTAPPRACLGRVGSRVVGFGSGQPGQGLSGRVKG
ncbi:ribonuclease H-like domain-containing protein [Tanacetum coccineum]